MANARWESERNCAFVRSHHGRVRLVRFSTYFDSAAMIHGYLTEESGTVVRFDLIMWVIATRWTVFPDGSYGGFSMKGLS